MTDFVVTVAAGLPHLPLMHDSDPTHDIGAVESTSSTTGKRIRVVGDEIDIIQTISMLLSLHGFRQITVSSALEVSTRWKHKVRT